MKKFFKYLILSLVAIISFLASLAYCDSNSDKIKLNLGWWFLWAVFFAFVVTTLLYLLFLFLKNKTTFKIYLRRIAVLLIYAGVSFSIWYCALNFVHFKEKSTKRAPYEVKIVE